MMLKLAALILLVACVQLAWVRAQFAKYSSRNYFVHKSNSNRAELVKLEPCLNFAVRFYSVRLDFFTQYQVTSTLTTYNV
jgi:hypothetical protein